MKKIIFSLILGLIVIGAEVAAFSMEYMTKEVLTGAILTVILPLAIVIAYFDFERKNSLLLKKTTVLPARKELAIDAEIEVHSQMSERPTVQLREKNFIASL
jgi:hypothetical protein